MNTNKRPSVFDGDYTYIEVKENGKCTASLKFKKSLTIPEMNEAGKLMAEIHGLEWKEIPEDSGESGFYVKLR